ncbi:hypothetical protein GJ496_004150 [Pomphorhynchus laevis]|nr:hypothetical protein GJ496_004150 [Pomphorhynchus laevis]
MWRNSRNLVSVIKYYPTQRFLAQANTPVNNSSGSGTGKNNQAKARTTIKITSNRSADKNPHISSTGINHQCCTPHDTMYFADMEMKIVKFRLPQPSLSLSYTAVLAGVVVRISCDRSSNKVDIVRLDATTARLPKNKTMTLITLTNEEKHEIEDRLETVANLQWEVGQYAFYDFVEHFQLPQIIKVKKNIEAGISHDQYIFLHSIFDRYAILAKSNEGKQSKMYILSDWYKLPCKIISPNPMFKTRWWVFQNAFELFRFEFPRRIKILSFIPVHRRLSSNPMDPWVKVVLNKDIFLNAVSKCSYQSILPNEHRSTTKEGFILQDEFGGEYIIPPAVPLRFATVIDSNEEIQPEYKNNHGEFSLSEILMRYDFPLNIRLSLPNNKSIDLILENFCVAKSVLGFAFRQRSEPSIVELSPEKNFLLHCHRSLTVGLPRDPEDEMESATEDKVDNVELNRYNNLLSKLYVKLERPINAYKELIREAAPDEIASTQKAYELSINLDRELEIKNRNRVYLSVKEAIEFMEKTGDHDGIPFDEAQPSNFTVHICADPANPYNEAIDYELFDDMEATNGNNKGGNYDQAGVQQPVQKLCEAVVMQTENYDPIPKEVFEKTVSEIPDKLIIVS